MSLVIEAQAEPIPGYRLLERLGSGGFGEVWKVEAPGGLQKAIKIIHGDLGSNEADGARHAEQELRAIQRVQAVRHPYLLSLERYDIVEGRLLIVMELADCNLWDRFREYRAKNQQGIPRAELLRYMEESAEVLDVMNNRFQLLHLDVKPQNLFLVHNHVKVADFGLVKDLEGMRATITGGVTPVYAAPETFENTGTRSSDQYSLAIVYQELLTGVRPFNGSNMQQLLVQHMQGQPNLIPLSPADRPIVAKALAKKPEDRFDRCMDFVRALIQATPDAAASGLPAFSFPAGRADTPQPVGTLAPMPPMGASPFPPFAPPAETPKTEFKVRREGTPSSNSLPLIDYQLPGRIAPPELTGEGVLRPAVVIGMGNTALRILRRFRRQVIERFGAFERVPSLRLLYLDTDPDTLQLASGASNASPLAAGEILPMRLNRASHYLKPRRNGRSLIEGWFDSQSLYKIPRNPQTLGLRPLGRLAFSDHFKTFISKLRDEIEASAHPDTLAQADRHTRLGLRTNRPRVYVVAGLAGGTGSGMFLDVAYTVRLQLRKLGYLEPDVVGLLLVPPADRGSGSKASFSMSNTYAALREMNHYSRPDTTFTADHDDPEFAIRDSEPPFRSTYILTMDGQAAGKSRTTEVPQAPETSTRRAADFLRREMITHLGRATDDARLKHHRPDATEVCTKVFTQGGFFWPKQVILTQTARWLGETLISRWLSTDVRFFQGPVRSWLTERWKSDQLGPDALGAQLNKALESSLGQSAEQLFTAEAAPYIPKGWMAKHPDKTRLWQTVSKLLSLVGMPDERAMQRQVGTLEQLLDDAADNLTRDIGAKFKRLCTSLLEHPDYRIGGAEEGIHQLQAVLENLLQNYEPKALEMGAKSIQAYYLLNTYLTEEFGRKKCTPADLAEAVRDYPLLRCQSLVLRQVCRVYFNLRTSLVDHLREITFCRQRLEDLANRFRRESLDGFPEMGDGILLPPGCASIEQAVQALQDSVTPEDLRTLDKRFQRQVELEYQSLFSVCMSSLNMLGNLQAVIEEQARSFLASRVGDSEVVSMFLARFAKSTEAATALRQAYDELAPPVRLSAAEGAEFCVIGVPEGEHADYLQKLAPHGIPKEHLSFTSSTDEILLHRELIGVPLTILPQLGPLAEEAYNLVIASGHGCPHIRTDVPIWSDVEAG